MGIILLNFTFFRYICIEKIMTEITPDIYLMTSTEQKNIDLSPEAVKAISALRHSQGTFDYYVNALRRIFNLVLHQSEEIGMSYSETVATLRAISGVIADLSAIAGDRSDMTDESGRETLDAMFGEVSLVPQDDPAYSDEKQA